MAVDAEHALLHALPRLSAALVHADPQPREGTDDHAVLASHRPAAAPQLRVTSLRRRTATFGMKKLIRQL